jgi:hypothetical protein
MRRTTFLALLAALLLVPTAQAAGPTEILRDCFDDGVLQGKYTSAELRNARAKMPTDIDEYSDCRDVLSRAIAATASSSGGGNGSGSTDPGTLGGGTSAGGGTGGSAGGSGGLPPEPTPDAAQILGGPSTPQDAAAVAAAAENGDRPVEVAGKPVSPGASRLASEVGRNGLPTSTVLVLALLGGVLLAALLPSLLRRRGVAPGQP